MVLDGLPLGTGPGCAHAGVVMYGVSYGAKCTAKPISSRGDSVILASIATIDRAKHHYCALIQDTIEGLLRAGRVYWFEDATEPLLEGIARRRTFVGINRRAMNIAETVRHEAAHAAGFLPEGDATYMAAYCWNFMVLPRGADRPR